MTIEQYSRNVTSRLLGLDVIRYAVVSPDISPVGSREVDAPAGDWEEAEFSELSAFSLVGLECTFSSPGARELSNVLFGRRGAWVARFGFVVADSVW